MRTTDETSSYSIEADIVMQLHTSSLRLPRPSKTVGMMTAAAIAYAVDDAGSRTGTIIRSPPTAMHRYK